MSSEVLPAKPETVPAPALAPEAPVIPEVPVKPAALEKPEITEPPKKESDHDKLEKICNRILARLPMNVFTENSTEEFKTYIEDLVAKNISRYEIDCLIRAQAYFNQLMLQNLAINPKVNAPNVKAPDS